LPNKTIAIDFDHTLVNGSILLSGAKKAINRLRELGYYIIIHSCNDVDWIKQVLHDNDVRYDSIWDDRGKPIAAAYIDDKAVRFSGDWDDTLDELQEVLGCVI
jgi:hydroxymethylpyrimidine pyrophosphatase-like HAD family hydrolase